MTKTDEVELLRSSLQRLSELVTESRNAYGPCSPEYGAAVAEYDKVVKRLSELASESWKT